jgi:hypothetical protein
MVDREDDSGISTENLVGEASDVKPIVGPTASPVSICLISLISEIEPHSRDI